MRKWMIALVACCALTTAASAQVVINEVATLDDWIEVCNLDPANPVAIGDWGLAYFEDTQEPLGSVFRFPGGTVLLPGECCIVTDDNTLSIPTVPAGTQVFAFPGNILWNAGEAGSLLLFDQNANGIDYYAHGNPNQFLAPFEGSSFIVPMPAPGVPTSFTGDAAPLFGGPAGTSFANTLDHFYRHSRVDTDTAADWTMRPLGNETPGALNPFQDLFDTDALPPVPVIEASAMGGISPLEVTFTNASSGDCELVNVLWDFDATANPFVNISSDHNAIFTYALPIGTPPGTTVNFDVTLTITDNCGASVTSAPVTITISTPNPIPQVVPYAELFEGPIDPLNGTSAAFANGWDIRLNNPTSRVQTDDPRNIGADPATYVDSSFCNGPTAAVLDTSLNSNFTTQSLNLHIDAETILMTNSSFRIQMMLLEQFDETHPQDVIAFQDGFTVGNGVDNNGISTGAPGLDGFQEVLLLDWNSSLGGSVGSNNWRMFEFVIDANFLMNNGLAAPGSGNLGDCRLIIRQHDNFMYGGNDGLVVDAVKLLPPVVTPPGQEASDGARFDINSCALNVNEYPTPGFPTGMNQEGPHFITLSGGDPMSLQFFGDPGQKVTLLGSSQLNPGAFDVDPFFPGVGQVDIGTPMLTDLVVIFDGTDTTSIPNLFFETDANGELVATFNIPVSVSGAVLPLQAFLFTSAAPNVKFSNAIQLSIL